MGRLFGTDGVRGVAGSELTAELAYSIGRVGAYVLASESSKKPKIVVGKDTRISGDMLEFALISGILSVGAEVVRAGVIPTPAIAYLVREKGFDAGVMISASHNPFEHNGIKFFNSEGYKLSDDIEERIESIILDNSEEIGCPEGAFLGKSCEDFSLRDEYIDFAVSTSENDFSGLTIAIDCANGASSFTAEKALKKLGAEVLVLSNSPDGININLDCGSTHIEALSAFVKEEGADLGLAFDGDADRVLAVDENGALVDGDKIMSIIGLDLKNSGRLKKNTVVATVMSNLGFFVMGKENGIDILKTKVGDRYVLEEMLKGGYSIGGEQSGHVILLDYNTTGDGLVTGIKLVSVLKKSGKKMSELAGIMQVYPQVLINARVSSVSKYKYDEDDEIRREISKIEEEFSDSGRVLIRPSGTEPLVRVMIEGKDEEVIKRRAQDLAELIERKLG